MATANLGNAMKSESNQVDQLNANGLQVETRFCPDQIQDPFDTVDWETRSAAIKGENGEVLFEQNNCEVPTSWSQLATNVIVSKYF